MATKKIVCFSDTHGLHRDKKINKWFKNNPADVLIFAGDYQRNNLDTGEDFVKWISGLSYKHKIVIPGNHDGNFAIAREKCKNYNNTHFLVHDSITVEEIKFFCSAYSRIFGDWSFMADEDTLEYLYKKIPDNTEILVTHSPPFGKLDLTTRGINAGSTSLNNRIKELSNLQHHFFGHIHEGRGAIAKNSIQYINCSVTNELYELVNNPYKFEIKT